MRTNFIINELIKFLGAWSLIKVTVYKSNSGKKYGNNVTSAKNVLRYVHAHILT